MPANRPVEVLIEEIPVGVRLYSQRDSRVLEELGLCGAKVHRYLFLLFIFARS